MNQNIQPSTSNEFEDAENVENMEHYWNNGQKQHEEQEDDGSRKREEISLDETHERFRNFARKYGKEKSTCSSMRKNIVRAKRLYEHHINPDSNKVFKSTSKVHWNKRSGECDWMNVDPNNSAEKGKSKPRSDVLKPIAKKWIQWYEEVYTIGAVQPEENGNAPKQTNGICEVSTVQATHGNSRSLSSSVLAGLSMLNNPPTYQKDFKRARQLTVPYSKQESRARTNMALKLKIQNKSATTACEVQQRPKRVDVVIVETIPSDVALVSDGASASTAMTFGAVDVAADYSDTSGGMTTGWADMDAGYTDMPGSCNNLATATATATTMGDGSADMGIMNNTLVHGNATGNVAPWHAGLSASLGKQVIDAFGAMNAEELLMEQPPSGEHKASLYDRTDDLLEFDENRKTVHDKSDDLDPIIETLELDSFILQPEQKPIKTMQEKCVSLEQESAVDDKNMMDVYLSPKTDTPQSSNGAPTPFSVLDYNHNSGDNNNNNNNNSSSSSNSSSSIVMTSQCPHATPLASCAMAAYEDTAATCDDADQAVENTYTPLSNFNTHYGDLDSWTLLGDDDKPTNSATEDSFHQFGQDSQEVYNHYEETYIFIPPCIM